MTVLPLDQHVRHLSKGVEVFAEEWPRVRSREEKDRFLSLSWQSAEKLSRCSHQNAYEKQAQYLPGLLREIWDGALEEVLLGGVVERS